MHETRAQPAHIRSYRGGDEQAILSVWNRALASDGISLGVFIRNVLCDPNFDPEGLLLAESAGEVAGFVLAIRRLTPLWGADLEADQGWITAWAVSPDRQRQGIGTALLDRAEAFLKRNGVQRASVSPYAPNYFWPGVDREAYPIAHEALAARGYKTAYQAAAMDKSLVGYTTPDDARQVMTERESEGYTFTHLTPDRIYEVIRFAAHHFNPDWGRAIREAVAAGVPTDQFHLAIDPDGAVVGFALHGGYGGIDERFGPFGVAESQRGKGLGKALLHRTLDEMRRKGLHGAWFLWTGEESAAGRLYLKAGFTVTRTFDILTKEL